jgi:hypothetical protein
VTGETIDGNVVEPADQLDRLVKAGNKNGRFSCAKLAHYRLLEETGRAPRATIIAFADLLRMMVPFVDARCSCEVAACQHAWKNNRPGQLQTEFVAPGQLHKGYGKVELDVRTVECVHFTLTAEEMAALNKLYPNYIFCCVGDGYHDHPVSHTASVINARRMWLKLPSGTATQPVSYLDLHGNPGANERFMQDHPGYVIYSLVRCESARDIIRSRVKWGPQFAADGHPRWFEGCLRDLHRVEGIPFDQIIGVVAYHTMYYYDFSEIWHTLNVCSNSLFYGVMHRHKEMKGSFYNGEHVWDTVPQLGGRSNFIEQTNVRTGQKYCHPSNERWFLSTSTLWGINEDDANLGRALTWDTNMLNAETYFFTVAHCPTNIARCDPGGEAAKEIFPEYVDPSAVALTTAEICRFSTVDLNGVRIKVPRQHGDLIEAFRRKPRGDYTDQAFRSFQQKCLIHARDVKVLSTDLDNAILIAYWCDYSANSRIRRDLIKAHSGEIASSHSGSLVHKAVVVATEVVALAIEGKGPRGALAASIREAGRGTSDFKKMY